MYEFVTGPLAWIAFLIFFIGVIVRAVMYIRGLRWNLDRVAYRAFPLYGFKGAVRSIVACTVETLAVQRANQPATHQA